MYRAVLFAGACHAILAAAAPAHAAPVSASAGAHAAVAEAASVRMNWMMAMPSVTGTASGASFMGNSPSMGMGMMMMPIGAELTVRREDDGGEPVTAPSSFEVVRNGGEQALIVRTAGGDGVQAGRDGVLMGGSILGGSAASIGVAAPSRLLLVVVQYN